MFIQDTIWIEVQVGMPFESGSGHGQEWGQGNSNVWLSVLT